MFKSSIYKKDLLNEDITYDIAEILLRQRQISGKSLEEVSRYTKIDLLELDSLECGHGDIDFTSLARLLDYYNIKLKTGRSCFPGLTNEDYDKYFLYESISEAYSDSTDEQADAEQSHEAKLIET